MPRASDLEEELVTSVQSLASARSLLEGESEASSHFLAATSRLPVSNLGYWERTIRNELAWAVGRRISLNVWSRKKLSGPWLHLFNGSGYQREEALDAITDGAPSAFLFAIMLRRLNDWVPEVRETARESVKRNALRTEAEVVVDALWGTLPYLHSWGRWQEREREALVNLVCIGNVPELLAARIVQSSSGPAATVLSQAARAPAIDRFLTNIAHHSIQPAVRAKAYKIALDEQASWLEDRKWVWKDKYWGKGRYEPVLGTRILSVSADRLSLLRDAAMDKSPAVRRIAGATIIARLAELGEEALPLAKLLAADVYPSIAERGQFALDRIT
ncbi:MAG: hypothetical protein AAGA44_15210 [Pseudomonadota bacterium]